MTVLLSAAQISWAVQWLKSGEPVALPTETVYGLAAPALNEKALAKIFKLKARPHFDPLIVHVLGQAQAAELVEEISPLHEKLIKNFWPGPLTLLFRKKAQVPDLCTAGSSEVAIRSPAHTVFREVLEKLQSPLAAPSANRFGRISPTAAREVIEELGAYGLQAVVDGGACEKGIESTVLRVASEQQIEVLRPGAVSLEQIQAVVGPGVTLRQVTSPAAQSATNQNISSPGQLDSHYAPRTPLVFVEKMDNFSEWARKDLSKAALIQVFAHGDWKTLNWKKIEILSTASSDAEAAAKLFGVLRQLDASGVEMIVALKTSDEGLGVAINDRLRRAGAKNKV